MTCIVGIEHDGKVTIGGDSALTSGWSLTSAASGKVFANGAFIVGVTGSVRLMQLLRYRLELPSVRRPMSDADCFMATVFVDAVRTALKDGGWTEKDKEREDAGGEFLVGIHDRLYEANADFQVKRVDGEYNAVGCAEAEAKGSLYSTAGVPADERLLKALEAAEAHNAAVRRPFTFMSTE